MKRLISASGRILMTLMAGAAFTTRAMNNDGNVDIAWRIVWHMNDSSFVTSGYIVDSGSRHVVAVLPWQFATTGDFNNDLKTDVFLRDVWYGQNGIWNMNGTIYTGTTFFTSETSVQWNIFGANHFNPASDSSIDILWRNSSSGAVRIWLMNGATKSSQIDLATRPLDWKICGTGDSRLDLDHDGLPDLWEITWFGNLNQSGTGDPDGDHYTNLQEWQNGSDPNSYTPEFFNCIGRKGIADWDDFGQGGFMSDLPDTMGAVGPNHFVEILNNLVRIYNKGLIGEAVGTIPQTYFFRTSVSDQIHGGNGDPRVMYDPDLGRWLAVARDKPSDSLIFAISNGPDPVGSGTGDWVHAQWHQYPVVPRAGASLDFPTLGFDRNGIYITVRVGFYPPAPNLVIAIPKTTTLRSGGSPTFQTIDVASPSAVAIQPAVNYDSIGATDPALFVTRDYLAPTTKIAVGRLTWSGTTASVNSTWPSVTLSQPGFDVAQSDPGTVFWPLDPLSQGSSSRIQIHSRGFGSEYSMAVIRNGYLWTCHTIGVNSSGLYTGTFPNRGDADRTACEWLKFQIVADGSGSKTLQPVDYARLFDSTPTRRSYFMPSIAANSRGDVVLACSGSAPTEYIGAYCSGRRADAGSWPGQAHALALPGVLFSGQAVYDKVNESIFDTASQTYVNYTYWGDYSFTCIDPSDDFTFWTVQEYSDARFIYNGNSYPSWGTRIGAIRTY